jgi:hypothetical protein
VHPAACPKAPGLAVVQMVLVARLVRRPILPVHPTAKDTFGLDPQASGAWVDPDVARLGAAADLPAPCSEAVPDFRPSASEDAPVWKIALPCRWLPKPQQDELRMAARDEAQKSLPPVVAQELLPVVVPAPLLEPKANLQAAQPARQDESELPQGHSPVARA